MILNRKEVIVYMRKKILMALTTALLASNLLYRKHR